VSSDKYEQMGNVAEERKIIVINDLNLSLIAKYFDPEKFVVQSLSEWKKTKKPFDIWINWTNLNIGNIEKELRQIENMAPQAKPNGKIINIIDGKTNKFSSGVLVKYLEELSAKYYPDLIGLCAINLDSPIDSISIEFILSNKWNLLTGRVFSNNLVKSKSPGYLLGISEQYSKSNLLVDQVAKNKFNGESVVAPDIEPSELTVYSNTSGILANRLSQIHNVKPDQIQFHNGIMGFLQQMVPVFVPESYEIICWQMDYLTRIGKSCDVIHVDSVIEIFQARPNYEQIKEKLSSKTRLIYLCGPLEKITWDKFVQTIPENIPIIIDFCYNGFSNANSNLEMGDCIRYKNYVLGINTFSKANGLAGVHLSYSIGHEHIQTIIANYFHYPVNLFYEKLAVKSLEPEYINKVKAHYKTQADKITKVLTDKKIPYWFELVTTIQIDIRKLNKEKILENLNKTGLGNYWKISGNNIKIFISLDEINTQLINSIIN